MFEAPFVPQLAIGMVSLPYTVLLLFIVEASGRPRITILKEPIPLASDLSVLEAARGLHLAIVQEVRPRS